MPYAASLRLPEEPEKMEPAHGRGKDKVVENAMKLELQTARTTTGSRPLLSVIDLSALSFTVLLP